MSTINSAKSQASHAVDKAKEAGNSAASAASDFATAAKDKAGEIAGAAKDKAGDLAKAAGQKADDFTHAAGQKVQAAADAVRSHGPQDGMLGNATKAVADTVDQAGRYLEHQGLSGMMGDVTDMIKRNPVPALLVGIGIGYLLSRALDRS